MADTARIKRLLAITGNEQDLLLGDLSDLVEGQLKNRLGGTDNIPPELEYIVTNVVIARFNQMGDEGKSSMTVEGESASWLTDLFAPFEKDIQRFLDRQNETVSGGSITFL
jgi:hypothetical protein